jgi:hypothetical protein
MHRFTCNGNATLQVDQENIVFEDLCHFSTLCKKYFVQVNSKTYYVFDRNGKQ